MSFDFRSELAAGVDVLGLEIPELAYGPLESYFDQLKKWSRKVNLIAKATTDAEIVEKHFLDSLTLAPFLQSDGTHLLDIGTGGGFPGLICKAALGDSLQLTLVEPRLKRVSFLRHIVRNLKLSAVDIYAKRLEEIPELQEEAFTHITCRAVTEIGPFIEMVSGFSKTRAQLVCMKGPKWSDELEAAGDVIEQSGYVPGKNVKCVLPKSGVQRTLLFFDAQ
ncbi:16S rRNA (guanine(527)-N(7))-methyltransferase RsmG [Desulforhopalus sp. 52FAK]